MRTVAPAPWLERRAHSSSGNGLIFENTEKPISPTSVIVMP
jgi:hypothetical protein